MTKYREILRLKALGLSEREIAKSTGNSRNTVSKVCKAADKLGLAWPLNPDYTDKELSKLFNPKSESTASAAPQKRKPNFEYIRKELLKNGVNKKLLWCEYLEECRQVGEEPLMYSQFCFYIQQDEEKRRATMHINHKPGEQIEVDWAGDAATIVDPDTGEKISAMIFVGVLTYSQYAYVEAFINEQEPAWIKAHVHMFEYFGGVTRILVPDNASTAVNHKQSGWYEPKLIRAYHEMAEHYNTAIIPARIRKPKDKPSVEGSVGHISTWVVAAVRNEVFFSLHELNVALREKLEAYNAALFQKKQCSRKSLFLAEEKPRLTPLPSTRFEYATWKQATVQYNYHISVDKMFYSVPYQYIKEQVDVRITDSTVEIFLRNERIASHPRLSGREGQYSTVKAHMPKDHQNYLEWDGDRFRRWAKEIGPNTYKVIDSILASAKVEQQNYRTCMGVLKLAKKHTNARLEAVCRKALTFTSRPSYKGLKNLFATLQPSDLVPEQKVTEGAKHTYAITRGSKYFGGK